jgi:hypothetical protein
MIMGSLVAVCDAATPMIMEAARRGAGTRADRVSAAPVTP